MDEQLEGHVAQRDDGIGTEKVGSAGFDWEIFPAVSRYVDASPLISSKFRRTSTSLAIR
jgi:hypothetical protein